MSFTASCSEVTVASKTLLPILPQRLGARVTASQAVEAAHSVGVNENPFGRN
ncbi:MAG: hypothetical protein NTX31_09170 [Burkholderiales bacterium]|nr:hypothetical protein [Burkholderiales bacterium]